ncbi:MAG: glycosyltransferase family A protein [Saprospiraceae bacterium]
MSFFSIIIPTFNRAHIIHRPIDSIIAQTFTDWELIIVDDGSTDNTKDIVDSYNDERIRYIWQENQERSAARNHGIKLAQGEWICFQDSDDEYLPDHLQVLFDGIKANPEYKILRTGLLIYENGKFIGKSATSPMNKYDQFPYECFTVGAYHIEVIKQNRFLENLISMEDLYFLLNISQGLGILVLPFWTGKYYYDARSSGGLGPNYNKNLLSRIFALDTILNWRTVPVKQYIIRQRCLCEVLLFIGHLKHNQSMVCISIFRNLRCIMKFPYEYLKLCIRMIYVKIGEWSGLYRTEYRF